MNGNSSISICLLQPRLHVVFVLKRKDPPRFIRPRLSDVTIQYIHQIIPLSVTSVLMHLMELGTLAHTSYLSTIIIEMHMGMDRAEVVYIYMKELIEISLKRRAELKTSDALSLATDHASKSMQMCSTQFGTDFLHKIAVFEGDVPTRVFQFLEATNITGEEIAASKSPKVAKSLTMQGEVPTCMFQLLASQRKKSQPLRAPKSPSHLLYRLAVVQEQYRACT